jgi:hypothetical protein
MIEIFNDIEILDESGNFIPLNEQKNIIVHDNSIYRNYIYKIKLTNNISMIYENTSIEETIDIKTIEKNMFINFERKGRFGNFMASNISLLLLYYLYEKKFKLINYNDTTNNIKKYKNIYYPYKCQILNDQESKENDIYKFNKNGLTVFKYFSCHHFNSTYIINLEDFDYILTLSSSKRVLLLPSENIVLYIKDNNIYSTIKYDCGYLFDCIENNLSFNDIINSDIKLKHIQINNIYINDYSNILNNINELLHIDIKNIQFIIKNIGGYLKLTTHDDSIKIHNNSIIIKTSIIEKIIETIYNNNKLIIYIPDNNNLNIPYKYSICYNHYQSYYKKTDTQILNLINEIKNILHPEQKSILNYYNILLNFCNQNSRKLVLMHMRAGDFENYDNINTFKILTPNYYITQIEKLLKDFKQTELCIFCAFHPNDLLFYAYINYFKFKYPNIKFINENELDRDDIKSILLDEGTHTFFLSLFQYVIPSNSTYIEYSIAINTNNPLNIYYDNLNSNLNQNHNNNCMNDDIKICYAKTNIKINNFCGMNYYYNNKKNNIHWSDILKLYTFILYNYNIFKLQKDIQINNIISNSEYKSFNYKYIFYELVKNVIYYDNNSIKFKDNCINNTHINTITLKISDKIITLNTE